MPFEPVNDYIVIYNGREIMDYKDKKNTILKLINDKNYKPMKQKEIAFLLQVPQEEKEEFRAILAELVSESKVLLTKRGKYQSLSDQTKQGTFTGHQKGFGFVTVEGEDEDYYIPAKYTSGAFNNDKVLIKVLEVTSGRRKEAQVIKIIEHANTELVGYFQKRKNYGFVIPDDRKFSEDIYISKRDCKNAVTGHKVVVRLTSYGDKNHKPEGKIIEILGHVNDPGTDILSIVRAYNLPMDFSKEIMDYIENIPDQVSEADCEGRLDLRDHLMVTIDGEDAKDLDDAVSLSVTQKGYELGVHIADVSHYVKEGSPLDEEALLRGTSIYLADRVIPMLPHKLSNGICSLNAGEDRLAMSCIMDIDNTGRVVGHRIAESVIRVDHRMSYNQVYDILENMKDGMTDNASVLSDKYAEYKDCFEMFDNMRALSALIRKRRMERGSIDFDFPEAEIVLSEDGEPMSIGTRDRNTAHKIIEDFMLAANEVIAEDYYWQELPFEFRVHEKPDCEKIEKLKKVIERFGYYFKTSGEDIHPKEFQKLLERISDTEEEGFISRMTLRSMQQARYSTQCSGHFGLAARYYCHFTSPIRRYPDLQIHRIIKENIHGGLTDDRLGHYNSILPGVAMNNSKRERVAQEVEREVEKLKKVQYMSRHIGDTFDGIVSGVTGYGMYVELANTVEGMVRISSIPDDFFLYDEENMLIYGKNTGITYRMGQKVNIRVAAVDKQMRTINFELSDM